MKQVEVTNWPERIALTLLVLGILALVFLAMRRGWINRGRRQATIPAPATTIGNSGSVLLQVPGRFVGSSTHGDWLDRVVVHDLGVPSKATLVVHADGVHFRRTGARDVAIPASAIAAVRLADAVGADVVSNAIVVTWTLGSAVIDSGFRADTTAAHAAALSALKAMMKRMTP